MNNIGIRKTIHAHNVTSKEKGRVVRMILEEHRYNQSNVETKKAKKGIMRTCHNPKNGIIP